MSTDLPEDALGDLHELLGDSHKGYLAAATRMKTPKLAQFLAELSNERQHMQQDLATALKRVLPKIDLENGTLKGDLHRTWMQIRNKISSTEDAAMLDECERGEHYLLERYITVMEDRDLPPDLFDLLRKQKTQVELTLSTIEQLHATATPSKPDEGARPI